MGEKGNPTQEEINKVLDDYNTFCVQEAEKQEQSDQFVLKSLREHISAYKVKKIREYLYDEGGIAWFLMGLVNETEVFGNKQEEFYWFKYIYIRQIAGPLGDDFTGTIFIPIADGLFLKAEYSC